MGKKPTVVLGVIGADCHAVGNKILEAVLTDAKINVVNLGVMVSQGEFIDAAIETSAQAILVSSLYGHGEIDCEGLRDHCIERGIEEVILYVGGNLVVGKSDFRKTEKKFKAMGYDRVFRPDCDLKKVITQLKKDITRRRKNAKRGKH